MFKFVFYLFLGSFCFGMGQSLAAKGYTATYVIDSIVNRSDGVHFQVTSSRGTAIYSAAEAKNIIEHVCPALKFAPGVMQ